MPYPNVDRIFGAVRMPHPLPRPYWMIWPIGGGIGVVDMRSKRVFTKILRASPGGWKQANLYAQRIANALNRKDMRQVERLRMEALDLGMVVEEGTRGRGGTHPPSGG